MNTATRETASLTHWKAMVWDAASPRWALDGDWFRGDRVNGYLGRAFAAGEPVWMAADAVVQMWQGELRARRDDRCTVASAMAACRRVAS